MENKEQFYDDVIAPYKGELEVWYADHRSVANYFKLIFLTVVSVLRPKSQAWRKAFKDLPEVPDELEPYL